MSGSFWKFSTGFTSLSNVSTLLEQYNAAGDETPESLLSKLLDESDLLQELLSNNTMLLEFLRGEKVLDLLVGLVVREGKCDWIESEKKTKKKDTRIKNASNNKNSNKFNLQKKEAEMKDIEENEDENENGEAHDTHDKGKKMTKVVSQKNDVNETATNNNDDYEEDTVQKDDDQDEDEGEEDEDEDEVEDEDEGEDDEDDDDDNDDVESEEDKEIRRASLAAEILAADVWSLTDTVMESNVSLDNLWAILQSKTSLSINLSTYFMKIMEHLLDMKCDEMITYLIENQPDLVSKFINHLSNPPLMDFLLKLISTDKPDNSTGIVDFLQRQGLIPRLISALDVGDDIQGEELLMRQSSAADFLKALITISANSTTDSSSIGPNELTRELVSKEQMERLCKIMLKGEYALANGVGIIIEIIRKNNSDYDLLPVLYITLESHPPTGRDPIYLGHLLRVFGDNISKFNELLSAPTNNTLKTPFGEIEPLGFERFKICELIAELLHCSNMALLNDNKGFDIVKERDEMRNKMKEYDPVSFKYNEVVVLPSESTDNVEGSKSGNGKEGEESLDESAENAIQSLSINDTVNSFNSRDDTFEETHANANLSEEQLRAKPVVGDYLKIALYDTQIISNILSMFFEFPWNNFLHNVVFDIVQQVLNGSMDIGFNKFLAIDLFDRGLITAKIVSGQDQCQKYESENNGLRLGYMGHLTLIAEEVVKFMELFPPRTLSTLIDEKVEDPIWEDYVNDVLYDTRAKYNALLGGGEEEDTTFDEGVGEILEESKFDDSEEQGEDDDHFSNYMSQELNTGAEGSIPVARSSDEDDDSSEDDDLRSPSIDLQQHTAIGSIDKTGIANDDDDDDYIDPNDDGLSYKRPSHPLYNTHGSMVDENELSEDSSSSSSEDELENLNEYDENDKTSGNKLTRSASKS